MNTIYYNSPVGLMEITESNGYIIKLTFVEKQSVGKKDKSSEVLKTAIKQLDEYFSGKRFKFDLPLRQEGTSFQQKAWDYLLTIPYGKTVSYKTEAESLGSPKAVRAVGSANGCNNIAVIVPCHRVINTNGKLGGYAYGLPIKEKLLKLETEYLGKI